VNEVGIATNQNKTSIKTDDKETSGQKSTTKQNNGNNSGLPNVICNPNTNKLLNSPDSSKPSPYKPDTAGWEISQRFSHIKMGNKLYQQRLMKMRIGRMVFTYLTNRETEMGSYKKDVIQSRRILSVEMNDLKQKMDSLNRGYINQNTEILNRYQLKSFDEIPQYVLELENRRDDLNNYYSKKIDNYYESVERDRLSPEDQRNFNITKGFDISKNIVGGGYSVYSSATDLINFNKLHEDEQPFNKAVNMAKDIFGIVKGSTEVRSGIKGILEFKRRNEIVTSKNMAFVTKASKLSKVAKYLGPIGESITVLFDVWEVMDMPSGKARNKKALELLVTMGASAVMKTPLFIAAKLMWDINQIPLPKKDEAYFKKQNQTQPLNQYHDPRELRELFNPIQPKIWSQYLTQPQASNGFSLNHDEIFGVMVRGLNKVIQNTA
jgi:hypothetical protein